MSDSPARYYPINNAEEEASEKLLGSSSISLQQPRRPESRFLWHWIAHAVLLCSTIGLLFANLRPTTTTGCAKKLSTFCRFQPSSSTGHLRSLPFIGAHQVRRSTLHGTGYPEIVRVSGYHAWIHGKVLSLIRRMATVKMIRLPKDSLRQIGKDDRPSLVRFRDEDGGGYMMSLEVGHQLHCLVRVMSCHLVLFDYYEKQDSSIQEDPGFYRLHLGWPLYSAPFYIILT